MPIKLITPGTLEGNTIFYLVLDNTVYRIICANLLDLFITHLPQFNPNKNIPGIVELGRTHMYQWRKFTTPFDEMKHQDKEPIPIPQHILDHIQKVVIAGSTGAVDPVN